VSEAEGLLDTNVFIHAYANDAHTAECRAFLLAVERGDVLVRLEPLVLHELSYALPRYLKQMSRTDVARYLLMVLSWKGVRGETDTMVAAVERWLASPNLAFVDAYLCAVAKRDGRPIYSKNVDELRAQEVEVPVRFPTD
jgi:predicted nucleic acid-binding protein